MMFIRRFKIGEARYLVDLSGQKSAKSLMG